MQVVGQRNAAAPQLFKQREVSFEKLGIGGLDQQFEQIFRRAFASRVFPPEMVRRNALLVPKLSITAHALPPLSKQETA